MTAGRLVSAMALLAWRPTSANAHRLDEYLQATILSIEDGHVQGEMRLAPGVAVASFVLGGIDTNGDGMVSGEEQWTYAARVLHDTKLSVDGVAMSPSLVRAAFPEVDNIKEGLGEIQIQFQAELPSGGPTRRLVFENHHQESISVYLVNCLASGEQGFQVIAQNRNVWQSFYQLDYIQTHGASSARGLGWRDGRLWLGIAALVGIARVAAAFPWRSRQAAAIR